MYQLWLIAFLIGLGISIPFIWIQGNDVFSPDPHAHIIRFSASDFPAESILLLSLDAYTFFPEPSGFATLTNLIFNAYEGNSGSLAVEVYIPMSAISNMSERFLFRSIAWYHLGWRHDRSQHRDSFVMKKHLKE